MLLLFWTLAYSGQHNRWRQQWEGSHWVKTRLHRRRSRRSGGGGTEEQQTIFFTFYVFFIPTLQFLLLFDHFTSPAQAHLCLHCMQPCANLPYHVELTVCKIVCKETVILTG